jgi:hypothetical protein
MIDIHVVSLGFAKFRKHKLGIFGGSVALALTDNPAFPNLPVNLVDLKAANDAYQASLCAQLNGGRVQTAAMNAARARLIGILRDEAHYVQIIAKNNLEMLLSSGFTAIDRNNAQSQLLTPGCPLITRPGSTRLQLSFKAVPNARAYQAQLKVGDGDWQDGGIHPRARKLILTGLIPGTIYNIRVRAVGGSTGYSSWGLVSTCMAV